MRINIKKRMYIPALSIVAVVLLLLVLIGISTYRNLHRDRRTIMSFLYGQGIVVFNSLEAGARLDSMNSTDKNTLGSLMREISKSEDIAYLYLLDPNGKIIDHYGPVFAGSVQVPNIPKNEDGIISRVQRFSKGQSIYEMIKSFVLSGQMTPKGESIVSSIVESTNPQDPPEKTIILGIEMNRFEESRRADIQHAIIMASILVVLGSGVLFFIFVIQNYYLVDRTLKQTRDYTRHVVENMANGLISIDSHGRVVSYNKLALDLLELEEKEIRGMDLRKIMDFEVYGISETLRNNSSVLEREVVYIGKSGVKIPISVSVTPIHTVEMDVNGAVIILRDLREIKRLREKVRRSEKLAAIGELAAGVAHEIRNPLSSIKGFAQFLRHVLKDRPEEKEYATVMVHEIDRINRVVTDLLIYAKPLSATRKKEDLNELLDHVILLINADAQSRGITIRKNLSGKLNDIWIDPNQITHTLLNLLLNSLEAVSEGGNIEIGAKLADSHELHLWVEDDGTGIPQDYQGKIMDPFFTTRDKGTGLGLAIVHKIIENHNGEIRIESPPPAKNRGTMVYLIFPLLTESEEEETK